MENLYHYCSLDSFEKIISNKSLRLSSLLLSNDYKEGNAVIELIELLLQSKDYGDDDRRMISEWLKFFRDHFHGIGFCLSEESDLLSQWRGYADDGAGVSIGFSRKILDKVCSASKTLGKRKVSLIKINYEQANHLSALIPILKNLKRICTDPKYKTTLSELLTPLPEHDLSEIQKNKNDKKDEELLDALLPISDELYTLKNDAFIEECEWRILSRINGSRFDKIECYANKNKLIPYDLLEMSDHLQEIIKTVILGPKNQTPPSVIKNWMKEKGYGEVAVINSTATYR